MTKENIEIKKETKNINRSCWVDTAKSFGIFLVFLGHIWYLSNFPLLNQMIYSFHVVAFFMLSGYVIKKRKETDKIIPFLWKKIKRLIIPAVICVLLTLPIYLKNSTNISLTDKIKRIFFFEGIVAYNDPVWFLIVMFEAVVIERLLKIKEKNLIIKIVYLFLFLFSGFFVYKYNIFLPFGFQKLLICLAFVILGILMRELINILKNNIKVLNIFLFITFIISFNLWFLFGVILNPKVSIYWLDIGNYWYFCLSGLFGSVCFFIVCYLISKLTKIFEIVGRKTVYILGTHYLFTKSFGKLAVYMNFVYTWIYNITAIIFTIVIIVLYCVVLCFFDKLHIRKAKIKSR